MIWSVQGLLTSRMCMNDKAFAFCQPHWLFSAFDANATRMGLPEPPSFTNIIIRLNLVQLANDAGAKLDDTPNMGGPPKLSRPHDPT